MKSTIYLFFFVFFALTQISISQTPQPQLILEQEVEVKTNNSNSFKNTVSFFIKNGKAKSTSNQQGMIMNIYYFSSTGIMHTILNMGGQIQKKQEKNALKNINSKYDKIQVEYFNQIKEIAGISCKKAIIKLTNNGNIDKRVVWYDPNTKLTFKYNFGVAGLELIKGLPMQYENSHMGIKMIHTVKKIEFSTNISKETFDLP